jgi:hypothetical protein
MQRYRLPAVIVAVALIAIGVGGLLVGNAVASSPVGMFMGGGPGGPWHAGGGWHTGALPPELAGLADVPADQRFSHFRGARVQLTDKNNQPVSVDVTPGTVTAASQTSLTMTTNDGASRTFAINDQTHKRGSFAQNDKVAVVTMNNASTATAIMNVNDHGFGPKGGPWGPDRWRD